MKRLVLLFLLIAAPCVAQTPEDIVSRNRARFGPTVSPQDAPLLLRSLAADLTQTLGQPYGVLPKTSGNHCGGLACDIICNAQFHWDVLKDGPDATLNLAGTSGAQWLARGPVPSACELVSAPAPPLPPAPSPQPTPQPAPRDDGAILSALTLQAAELAKIEAHQDAQDATLAALAQQIDSPGWLRKFLANRYVQLLGAAAVTWLTERQMAK